MAEPLRSRRSRAAMWLRVRATTPFRPARMRLFVQALTPTEDSLVLDVGGLARDWSLVEPRPRLTLLNLRSGDVLADGRHLPFRDKSFDIAFSNSTIEHVGDRASQAAFASEIARVGKNYFVQTPNRYFPIEPHYMTPLVQFLPPRVLRRVARNSTVWGWIVRPAPEVVDAAVDSIRLLSRSRMKALFPDAEIRQERLFGLTKSLIAIMRAPPHQSPELGPENESILGRTSKDGSLF